VEAINRNPSKATNALSEAALANELNLQVRGEALLLV
jgi:hypothetical protein